MSKAVSFSVEVDYGPSDLTANPRSSITMRRQCTKLGVVIAITFGLVYTTWQIYTPRHRRDRSHIDGASGRTNLHHKPDDVIVGEQILDKDRISISHLENETEDKEDSAYPFQDDDESDVDVDVDVDVDEKGDSSRPRIKTYFSSMDVSFSDVPIGEDNSIPTIPFLDACISTAHLFVTMQKMILNRVVDDIRGNVQKIRGNYDSSPETCGTLQVMTLRDIEEGRTGEDGTTALALTWLKRAFGFLSRFLYYIDAGEEQTACASKAYEETLRQYHGFATRAIFRAAFMTLSTRAAFLRDLALNQADIDDPRFEETAMEDLREYNRELMKRLEVLRKFFEENGLTN